MTDARCLQADDLLITPRLYKRRPRTASLEQELQAYRELSAIMASCPTEAIQRFLELAIELCPSAGSAGLSELTEEDGESLFRWTAMSGAFAPFVGGTTPRDFSPCGLCLDSHHTILVDRPARVFTYFNEAEPAIVEGLIVPLYDTGKRAIGTLWVVSHEPGGKFDATDARVMEQLAVQLVLAIKLRRKALIVSQLEEASRDNAVLIYEVRHRVKNMIQMTSSLLELQQRGVDSGEARTALEEAQSRLLVLASVYENLLQPSANIRTVDICVLLRALVHALQESSSRAADAEVQVNCEQLNVDVEQAVPIGLIVNEAVTNALKHARTADAKCKILVSLNVSGTLCSLSISDNGDGPIGDPRPGSLGMRLMRTLARQLRASITIDGAHGTTVSLQWTMAAEQASEVVLTLVD